MQYVEMMIASLDKKQELLKCIMEVNGRLEMLVSQPSMELEEFRILMDEKDAYVQQINGLNDGFQSVFDKIKGAINENRELYREQIRTMQQQIRAITDDTVKLEEAEAKLKLSIEGQFARMHREAQSAKKGMSVAQNYYKSMAGTHVIDSQFMDTKN